MKSDRLVILSISFVLSFSSCKKDDGGVDDGPQYDRTEMLKHFNDSLIVAEYKKIESVSLELGDLVNQLKNTQTAIVVENLQAKFDETYILWQSIAHLEFGPASDVVLKGSVNVYPTDTVQVNNNINNGSYDLATIDNLDAKGLPAISYLLYGKGNSVTKVADYFSNNPDAVSYFEAIYNDYYSKLKSTLDNWNNSYANTFTNNKGTDAGSSTSLVYNSLVSHLERYFRDGKIGIPAGKRTLGETLPEKTENYFKGESMPLVLANINAIYKFFKPGNHQTFFHYLTTLEAQYNGQPLAVVVDEQFKSTIAKLELIPDPLSTTIETNMAVIDTAYEEIQKLIVLLKTDVPSALGVLINYQDNDGD